MEGGAPADVNAPAGFISSGPACWNYPCQPYGDTDGNGLITATDVQALVAAWNSYDPCADFDHSGLVTASDVQILVNYWLPGCP